MRMLLALCTMSLPLAQLEGCGLGFLIDLLTDDDTTVVLVNNGNFMVDVDVRISDDQLILEDLLEGTGTLIEYSLQAGQTVSFSRDCEELQAIMLEDASLVLVGEIGPSGNTDVLRDGDDFNCGDTIVFTFDHPDIPTSLDIESRVESD